MQPGSAATRCCSGRHAGATERRPDHRLRAARGGSGRYRRWPCSLISSAADPVQCDGGGPDLNSITPAASLIRRRHRAHALLPAGATFPSARQWRFRRCCRLQPRCGRGVPRGAVITAVNSAPVATLADFASQVATLGDGERFTVRYATLDDPDCTELRSVYMDRRWFPARQCSRTTRAATGTASIRSTARRQEAGAVSRSPL